MESYIDKIERVTGGSEKIIANALMVIESRISKVDLDFIDLDTKGMSLDEFIQELSPIWKRLREKEKIETAKRVAGMYHIARFIALMEEQND